MRRRLFWLLLVFGGQVACAEALVIAWNPSPSATGYKLYYGTGSLMYQEVIDAHEATQVSLGGLHESYTYFFAATAYNPYGESGYSHEVSAVIESPVPIVTITTPVDGETVPRHEVVSIEADVTASSGVVIVTFLVNSEETCAVQNPPYRCDWPVPAANKRTYQLQARALDASGHMGVSALVEVTAQ